MVYKSSTRWLSHPRQFLTDKFRHCLTALAQAALLPGWWSTGGAEEGEHCSLRAAESLAPAPPPHLPVLLGIRGYLRPMPGTSSSLFFLKEGPPLWGLFSEDFEAQLYKHPLSEISPRNQAIFKVQKIPAAAVLKHTKFPNTWLLLSG